MTSKYTYRFSKNRLKQHLSSILFATITFAIAQTALASPTTEKLSDCLLQATTVNDKKIVLQWTYASLSAHPDLSAFSTITKEQKAQLDQNLAQVLQRIVVEQCATQTKDVIKTDGIQAVAESFQQLGQQAGEDIIKDPAVRQQLQGTLRYIDLNKLAMTFLSSDILEYLKP